MSGPVFSTHLYRNETLALERLVEQILARPVSELVLAAGGQLADQIRTAYLDGLRDGYAQGVAAAHERPDGVENEVA